MRCVGFCWTTAPGMPYADLHQLILKPGKWEVQFAGTNVPRPRVFASKETATRYAERWLAQHTKKGKRR